MSEESGSQGSALKSEMGTTTVSNTVVSQIAGIAAQEVEEAQMGGGGGCGRRPIAERDRQLQEATSPGA